MHLYLRTLLEDLIMINQKDLQSICQGNKIQRLITSLYASSSYSLTKMVVNKVPNKRKFFGGKLREKKVFIRLIKINRALNTIKKTKIIQDTNRSYSKIFQITHGGRKSTEKE